MEVGCSLYVESLIPDYAPMERKTEGPTSSTLSSCSHRLNGALDAKTGGSDRTRTRERAYVERVIGSIRRECLDHVIVLHETSLRRVLGSYFDYYHRSRTHLSLGKDSPEPRSIHPPEMGSVVAVSQVGGLHHRYERRAA